MKQHSLGLGMTGKKTRRREFLESMEEVVPWSTLVALVQPYLPSGTRGHLQFGQRHSGEGFQPARGQGFQPVLLGQAQAQWQTLPTVIPLL